MAANSRNGILRNTQYIVLIAGLWLCAQALSWHHVYAHTHDASTACSACHVATKHGDILTADEHVVFERSYQRFAVDRSIDDPHPSLSRTYRARAPPV